MAAATEERVLAPIEQAKADLTTLLVPILERSVGVHVGSRQDECVKLFLLASGRMGFSGRDLCLPMPGLIALLKTMVSPCPLLPAPALFAATLAEGFRKSQEGAPPSDALCQDICSEGGYVNFTLSLTFLARVVPSIVRGTFLLPLDQHVNRKDTVMIEYSQPNTHKAFHVGHMRNAALGDSLVRLYEQMGHGVIAANYFGDEGQHVATCLWQLQRQVAAEHPEAKLEDVLNSVAAENRGEWLGGFYARGVNQLSLSSLTNLPFAGVIAAKVLAKQPATKLPLPWHQVELLLNEKTMTKRTVLCSHGAYEVGHVVAFRPVASVARPDGEILSTADLCQPKESSPTGPVSSPTGPVSSPTGPVSSVNENKTPVDEMKSSSKTTKAKLKATKSKEKTVTLGLPAFVLESAVEPGALLTDIGKLETVILPVGRSVEFEWKRRKEECDAILAAMEAGDPEVCALWRLTAQWSFDEFGRIYKWLGSRFDRDFTESEMGKVSLEMVAKLEAAGKLDRLPNGAVGLDLSARGHKGLGFCLLRKANGSGLYATKDLALAHRKFDEFKIDRSLYVVAAEQEHHFKQVFKALEVLGYDKAKNCCHVAYGMVKLKSGKMSSRTGNVISFSSLQTRLREHISNTYLLKFLKPAKGESPWSQEQVDHAVHLLSVATIKYGMLKQDATQDIVFDLDEWAKNTGNTGPYLLYAFTRMKGVLRKVPVSASDAACKIRWSVLCLPSERVLLFMMNEFWPLMDKAVVSRNNPAALCDYLFNLCRTFSSWYEAIPFLKDEKDTMVRLARRSLVEALSLLLKKGLDLLGIGTLERM